jgi:hypothetical protein
MVELVGLADMDLETFSMESRITNGNGRSFESNQGELCNISYSSDWIGNTGCASSILYSVMDRVAGISLQSRFDLLDELIHYLVISQSERGISLNGMTRIAAVSPTTDHRD